MPGQRSDKNNGIRVIFFVISIFNVNVIKIYNMGEIKSITFQFNISIFTSLTWETLKYWDDFKDWDDFKVLERESNRWLLEIKESLLIKRDKPSLNKNIYCQELFLF